MKDPEGAWVASAVSEAMCVESQTIQSFEKMGIDPTPKPPRLPGGGAAAQLGSQHQGELARA
jgi:hypothetical protein